MSASSVAFVCALVYENQELLPVLSEHLDDNDGEVLPHLLIADIVRWLVDHRTENASTTASVFGFLNAAFDSGDDEIRNVIGASAVETIPRPGQPGAEFRNLMSQNLSATDLWQAESS